MMLRCRPSGSQNFGPLTDMSINTQAPAKTPNMSLNKKLSVRTGGSIINLEQSCVAAS